VSTEENKVVARHVIEEVMDKHNLALVDLLFAPNVVEHGGIPGQARE
jgi:hypothetical protein